MTTRDCVDAACTMIAYARGIRETSRIRCGYERLRVIVDPGRKFGVKIGQVNGRAVLLLPSGGTKWKGPSYAIIAFIDDVSVQELTMDQIYTLVEYASERGHITFILGERVLLL